MAIAAVALTTGDALAAKKRVATSTYYQHPVECLNIELDGSVTLRSYGAGRNRGDALEQARKNAVQAVIFKGVSVAGQSPKMSLPLVLENNGADKYQYFFNNFFKDGGAYKKFISKEDTRGGSNGRKLGDKQVEYSVTIRVMRAELRNYLVENNIIKP